MQLEVTGVTLSDADVTRIATAVTQQLGPAVLEQAEPWRLVELADACERLACGETLLRQYIADGELPTIRLGRRLLFDIDDLRAFARRHRLAADAAAVAA